MRFGFGVLRLAPDAFWALTPRELRAAWRAFHPDAERPFMRADLAQLMQSFPDGDPLR